MLNANGIQSDCSIHGLSTRFHRQRVCVRRNSCNGVCRSVFVPCTTQNKQNLENKCEQTHVIHRPITSSRTLCEGRYFSGTPCKDKQKRPANDVAFAGLGGKHCTHRTAVDRRRLRRWRRQKRLLFTTLRVFFTATTIFLQPTKIVQKSPVWSWKWKCRSPVFFDFFLLSYQLQYKNSRILKFRLICFYALAAAVAIWKLVVNIEYNPFFQLLSAAKKSNRRSIFVDTKNVCFLNSNFCSMLKK